MFKWQVDLLRTGVCVSMCVGVCVCVCVCVCVEVTEVRGEVWEWRGGGSRCDPTAGEFSLDGNNSGEV